MKFFCVEKLSSLWMYLKWTNFIVGLMRVWKFKSFWFEIMDVLCRFWMEIFKANLLTKSQNSSRNFHLFSFWESHLGNDEFWMIILKEKSRNIVCFSNVKIRNSTFHFCQNFCIVILDLLKVMAAKNIFYGDLNFPPKKHRVFQGWL